VPWQWVSNLMGVEGRKKSFDWDARCPYHLCPGNQPLNRHEVIYLGEKELLRKPKLKLVQKITPFIHQYKCGYCGNLTNYSVETPTENYDIKNIDPSFRGGKSRYELNV